MLRLFWFDETVHEDSSRHNQYLDLPAAAWRCALVERSPGRSGGCGGICIIQEPPRWRTSATVARRADAAPCGRDDRHPDTSATAHPAVALLDARDNAETEPVAVVSEALSRRLWNTADGTGRRLRRAGDEPGAWLTVIGVVGEVRKTYTDSLHPDVYLPFEQVPRAFGTVMVRTRTDPLALETRIREAAASADDVNPGVEPATTRVEPHS
jgi:hypothetical protein